METLFTLSWWIVLALALAAGVARGLSGFGVGLIMMPVGAVLLTPQVMVPVIALIDAPVALLLMGQAWKIFDRRDVSLLIISAVLCIPPGIHALLIVSAAHLSVFVNGIVLLAVTALLTGLRFQGKPSAGRSISLGGISGFLQASVSLPGPPIILGWVASQVPGPVLRANIIIYFLFIDAIVIPMHWGAGLFTEPVLWIAASLAPIYIFGVLAGKYLFNFVAERVFQKIVLALVLLGALTGLGLSILNGPG